MWHSHVFEKRAYGHSVTVCQVSDEHIGCHKIVSSYDEHLRYPEHLCLKPNLEVSKTEIVVMVVGSEWKEYGDLQSFFSVVSLRPFHRGTNSIGAILTWLGKWRFGCC